MRNMYEMLTAQPRHLALNHLFFHGSGTNTYSGSDTYSGCQQYKTDHYACMLITQAINNKEAYLHIEKRLFGYIWQ